MSNMSPFGHSIASILILHMWAGCVLAQTSPPAEDPFAPKAFVPLTAAQIEESVEKDRKETQERIVKEFKEPLLASIDAVIPTVRFVCIRTFHRPFCIRVFKDKDGPKLRVVRMAGKGGYDWGKIELDETKTISEEDWKRVFTVVRTPGVQSPLMALNPEERLMSSGLDGSRWYLESNANGKPSFADVWTPESLLPSEARKVPKGIDIKPFYEFGLMLVKLAGMPIDDPSDPIY
jgi:hypothetical protein